MSSRASVYRRIVRRETHSPRAVASIVVAVIIMVVAIAVGTAVMYAILHPPVWAAMKVWFDDVAEVASTVRHLMLTAGIVAVLLGVLSLVLALAPGRRRRRRLDSSRSAIVVDDKVIARALATKAADAARLSRSQVSVLVGRRRATVRVTPTAGIAVDRSEVAKVIARAGAGYGLSRQPHVAVSDRAVVG